MQPSLCDRAGVWEQTSFRWKQQNCSSVPSSDLLRHLQIAWQPTIFPLLDLTCSCQKPPKGPSIVGGHHIGHSHHRKHWSSDGILKATGSSSLNKSLSSVLWVQQLFSGRGSVALVTFAVPSSRGTCTGAIELSVMQSVFVLAECRSQPVHTSQLCHKPVRSQLLCSPLPA